MDDVSVLTPDLALTCPRASLRVVGEHQLEYGVPGLQLCGLITARQSSGWSYSIYCHAAAEQGRITCHVRGSHYRREEAVRAAGVWLEMFGCPGHVPDGAGV